MHNGSCVAVYYTVCRHFKYHKHQLQVPQQCLFIDFPSTLIHISDRFICVYKISHHKTAVCSSNLFKHMRYAICGYSLFMQRQNVVIVNCTHSNLVLFGLLCECVCIDSFHSDICAYTHKTETHAEMMYMIFG